jgi:NAD(P)-dependent dehydrogenase (short-subunit alcohol dehydrogenase family)
MGNYRNIFSLDEKVALVAGGGGAIGGEMAMALADFGAKIAIADLSESACQVSVKEIQAAGGEAAGVFLDVLSEESIRSAIQAVEDRFGRVDILVNAVGTHIEQPAHEFDSQSWDTVLDVNLRGAFLLSKAVSSRMIARGTSGSHIHITSVRSNLGIRRGYAAYVASKGGLAILIKQLATEWAPFSIRVNGIAPTFTRTPLVADYLNDPDFYQGLVNRIPMGRICETSDLAGLAVFLASDASSFITGQNIFVDGGVTASQ